MAFFSSVFFSSLLFQLQTHDSSVHCVPLLAASLRLGRGSWSFLPLPWALWDSASRVRGCQISLNAELLMHALHVLTPPPTPRLCGIFVRTLNCSFQIYSSQKKRGSVQQEGDCFTSRPCERRGEIWKTVTSRQSYHLHPSISPVCGWLIMFIILKTFSSYS